MNAVREDLKRRDDQEGEGHWRLEDQSVGIHHRLSAAVPGSTIELREATLDQKVKSMGHVTWRDIFREYEERGIARVSNDERTVTRTQPHYAHIPTPADVAQEIERRTPEQIFDLSTQNGVFGLIANRLERAFEYHHAHGNHPDLREHVAEIADHIVARINETMLSLGDRFHLNVHFLKPVVSEACVAKASYEPPMYMLDDLVGSFIMELHNSKVHCCDATSFRHYSPQAAA